MGSQHVAQLFFLIDNKYLLFFPPQISWSSLTSFSPNKFVDLFLTPVHRCNSQNSYFYSFFSITLPITYLFLYLLNLTLIHLYYIWHLIYLHQFNLYNSFWFLSAPLCSLFLCSLLGTIWQFYYLMLYFKFRMYFSFASFFLCFSYSLFRFKCKYLCIDVLDIYII